ncbi:Ribosome biogenesis protein Noc4 [Mycena chlorophos]|uniref:Ribosome biogenesis protein Noc4 n=1 Tax=Mycena chlorophos TaxID=658473 RepID=A0A8H6SBQ3_MYCCL|nr:Ribosome biogenesis protein Noc4 [Mycena chlorophos]
MARSAPSSLPPPAKKRKIQKDSDLVKSVQTLEKELTAAAAANASLNPLADLLELALSAEEAQETSKAMYSLYRVFVVIISGGKLNAGGDEAAKIVRAWIWERLNAYVDFLCGLLKDEEKILRTSALQILFSLQKHLSTAATASDGQPQFHIQHFRKIVSALLTCPESPRAAQSSVGVLDTDVLHSFHETWFSVHDDVRWFFLREAGSILSAGSISAHAPQNLLSILEGLTTFPTEKAELNAWWVEELGAKPPKPKSSKGGSASDEEDDDDALDGDDDWRKFFDEDSGAKEKSAATKKPLGTRLHKLSTHQSLHSLQSHRAVFTRAWLALLPKLSGVRHESTRKVLLQRALNVMHRGVMPHLTRPVLIMDWVGGSVDYGGTVGLLALNALFMLMKDYNLDYPSFYTKLYAFLDRDVLHSKHRARFFRLTELFLSSTHLPAALVASFVKRLARLSLSAPPAAIVLILPFTYNALKRHPALMPMIHRAAPENGTVDADPFDDSETNPVLTHAIDSSLWELASHRSHWLAGVSTMSRILEEAFTKQSYAMEDFLDHTYGTLFDADASRKIRKEPPVAMELGKNMRRLFTAEADSEELGSAERDVVSELWDFGTR